MKTKPAIVMQTDFTKDISVCTMQGVCMMVDPGVGTGRRACAARLKNGSFVVTPDNGSLTHLKKFFGIEEVRVIDETRNRIRKTEKCNIFHGRDR